VRLATAAYNMRHKFVLKTFESILNFDKLSYLTKRNTL